MAENVSRRKYGKLAAYFTEVMTNKHTPTKLRMTAATRLDDLLARADARADKAAERAHRRQLVELQAASGKDKVGQETAKALAALDREEEAASADDDAEIERISAVFSSVLGKTDASASA